MRFSFDDAVLCFLRALFKIVGVVLRPPLDAKPRCHADGAADECDCDKPGFEFGSHVAFHADNAPLFHTNRILIPCGYCHSSTSNSPKKSLPFGLAVSGCADLLKPPNVAAQPQPDRLLVWNCRRRAGATSGLNKLTFGDAKKVDFEHLGCCRWPTYMPIQFSSGRYPIR